MLRFKYIIIIINYFFKCSSMAVHSKFPLVTVGTQSGRLIFIDLTDENSPKIIENCRMHKKASKLLKYYKDFILKK
jgi:hypothetical protein